MNNIDISTFTLAEQACDAMSGKIATEEILSIWYSIGKDCITKIVRINSQYLVSF